MSWVSPPGDNSFRFRVRVWLESRARVLLNSSHEIHRIRAISSGPPQGDWAIVAVGLGDEQVTNR